LINQSLKKEKNNNPTITTNNKNYPRTLPRPNNNKNYLRAKLLVVA
jgi:hypothetical protein